MNRVSGSLDAGVRIWHQSISELGDLPQYTTMLRKHADRVTGPRTSVEVHGMRPDSYPTGVPPIEALASPLSHYLANVQIVESAVRAEHERFDAVAVTCFHDPALAEARSAVSIPVVSMCESSLLTAATAGHDLGLVGIGPTNARLVRECVRRYGLAGRVVDVVPVAEAVDEHEIDADFGHQNHLTAAFLEAARRTIATGAEVVVPCESVLNTALVQQGVGDVDGVPVLDAFAAMLAHAEMLVQLQRATGFGRPPVTAAARAGSTTLRAAAAAALAEPVAQDRPFGQPRKSW